MFPTTTRGHRSAALALPLARSLWYYKFADLFVLDAALLRSTNPIPPFSLSHPPPPPIPNPRTTAHSRRALPHTPRSGLTTTSSPLSVFSPCSPLRRPSQRLRHLEDYEHRPPARQRQPGTPPSQIYPQNPPPPRRYRPVSSSPLACPHDDTRPLTTLLAAAHKPSPRLHRPTLSPAHARP